MTEAMIWWSVIPINAGIIAVALVLDRMQVRYEPKHRR